MENDEFLEYFNIIEKLTNYVYEDTNLLHIEALTKVLNCILEIDEEIDFEVNEKLFKEELLKLDTFKLTKDSMLKALQLLVLDSFKKDEFNFSMITPNNIGLLVGYILKRLMKKKDNLKVIDPNIGTGNLLLSACKDLEEFDINYFGVDNDPLLVNLAKSIFNTLELDVKLYMQNPLTITNILKVDYIVSNVNSIYLTNNSYYPFEFIKKWSINLNQNGYMILLLDEAFFKNIELIEFKKEINQELKMQGIISLPKNLFKNNLKHIVIFQKTKVEIEKFLICELPEFENSVAFNQSIKDLSNWLNQKGE